MSVLHRIKSRLKSSLGSLGLAGPAAPAYYTDDIGRRDALLGEIYRAIDTGTEWLEAIHTPQAARHGERVAEYAFIYQLLRRVKPESILDVGCVLNNPVICAAVSRQSRICFMNPALEEVLYETYGYFKLPLSRWRESWTFPLVTCLSTLEHIGFDNTRYGVDERDLGWDWPRCIASIVESVETLYRMTAPGGLMVASCPFGRKEFVLHPPATGVRTAQVLHAEHVQALHATLPGALEISTLRLSERGWETCEPGTDFESYGAIGPGASGLILIVGRRA